VLNKLRTICLEPVPIKKGAPSALWQKGRISNGGNWDMCITNNFNQFFDQYASLLSCWPARQMPHRPLEIQDLYLI